MNSKKIRFCLSIILCGLLGGCQNAQSAGKQRALARSSSDTKTHIVRAAQEVLREMAFEIEKVDTDAGYLRTRPLRAGQFFEVWRRDNASWPTYARANLDTLRRIVEIQVREDNQIECAVILEKLYIPAVALRGATQYGHLYTRSRHSSILSLTLEPQLAQNAEWIGLGPDEPLQQRILQQIQKKLGS